MSKHKYIETPEKLLELFEEYKAQLKPREIQKATPRGVVSEFHIPPLTMSGFEVYCFKNHSSVHHYFDNPEGSYDAYRTICSHIKREIRQDQIEGGMVGQYNSSITQRLNGLTEKTENVNNNKTVSEINFNLVEKRKDD